MKYFDEKGELLCSAEEIFEKDETKEWEFGDLIEEVEKEIEAAMLYSDIEYSKNSTLVALYWIAQAAYATKGNYSPYILFMRSI